VEADLVTYNAAGPQKICIIDSGYFSNHEDLWENSHLTYSPDQDTGDPLTDRCGHGTHVAGTIAAVSNDLGVIGVLPSGEINLHIVKVFGDDCVWAYSSDLIAAADQCADNGANVINMSLGGSFRNRFEQRAFDGHNKKGVLSLAAAGNNGSSQKSYPASYDSVISVAAIDANDANNTVAGFSQKNSQVELAAPGVGVLSTVPWLETNTLTVGSDIYGGNYIENAARGTAGGPVVDGGLCTQVGTWGGNVVLCERGSISFYDKVMNVESGGGAAAVIYNNAPGNFLGTLGAGNSSNIPAISLSQADGQSLVPDQIDSDGSLVSTRTEPGNGYEAWDGTSMATPHVSGVAALVWSKHAQCTNFEIREALQATALDLGDSGRDNAYGFGLVQAQAADNYLVDNLCGGGDNGGSTCEGPGTSPVGASCTDDSECCSNKCKGRSGNKTCK
jgi:subtilisin family serine protease